QPGISRELPSCRVRYWHVRRQFELAWPSLDARERASDPCADPVLPLLWRQLPRRVSHWLWKANEPLRSGTRDRSQIGRHLSTRQVWTAPRIRGNAEVSKRPTLARLHPVPRVLSRRQRCRVRSKSPNRVDRHDRHTDRAV